MPLYATAELPKPRDWNEFEDMVSDIARIKLKDPYVSRFGRQGQQQQGVDIVGTSSDLKGYVGYQCKKVNTLSIQEIRDELSKAEGFSPTLKLFVIATSISRDTTLQTGVYEISQERQNTNLFPINIIFWEDMALDIAGNLDLVKKYYPQLVNNNLTYEKILETIQNSTIRDWILDDSEGTYTFRPDVNLRICRCDPLTTPGGEYEEYVEPWLNHFGVHRGYRVQYKIFYGSSFIKSEWVVGVDSFRGYIPFPSEGYTANPTITEWQYAFGKIIHDVQFGTNAMVCFDTYLERANITQR